MPGTTPKLALPYPTASDPDNVPGDVQALASAVEVVLGRRGLLSARPAAGNEGRFYDTIDTAQTFRDNGTSWDEVLFRASADAAYPSLAGGSVIAASGAAVKGLVVKGASSQTASLMEWRDSANTLLGYIRADGSISSAANLQNNYVQFYGNATDLTNSGTVGFITADTATRHGLVVRGAASQSANLVEFQSSAGSILANVAADGQWGHVLGGGIGYRTVQAGAADSAGTGFRTLRVAN